MSGFTEDQYAEIKEMFLLFDNRGDQTIPVQQIGDLLRSLSHNPTEAEVYKLCETHKEKERISFEEFLPMLVSLTKSKKHRGSADEFVELFSLYDRDGAGCISSPEIRYVLTHIGEALTDQEVEEIIDGHVDSQGNIHYEQWVRDVMTK